MIDLRAEPGIGRLVQDERVRRMAAFRVRLNKEVRMDSFHLLYRDRPPCEEEMDDIRHEAEENGLRGEFAVVADHVFHRSTSAGGVDVVMEMSEFHLFRLRDVPYLMSLKTALEVMDT